MRIYTLLLLASLAWSTLASQPGPPDPLDPAYAQIFQAYKNKLQEHGYPVGRAGNSAYVPGQYVLKYQGSNASSDFAADLAKLKMDFGPNNVKLISQCGCGSDFQIYAVEFRTLGGEEKGKAGKTQVAQSIGQEEVEPNFYVVPELPQIQDRPAYNQLPPNFAVLPSGKPGTPVTIALLDSGIDPYFQHPQVTNGYAPLYLWKNESKDPDPFCLPNDVFGWDFINDDNAPVDDNSHGTHIASRIAQQLKTNAPDVNYRFMSVKMLDHDGVGTTFHAACAVYYAAYHKADVINASWGFYGERDAILRGAFEYAESQGVATLTSAGNERQDISEVNHYPSSFTLERDPLNSIFFTSAARTKTQLWPLTNYYFDETARGSHFRAAPGANLWGLMPHHLGLPDNVARKSGTSIAAPFATALAAYYHHLHPGADPVALTEALKAAIEDQGTAATLNYNGLAIPYKVFSWVILQ
ncbi:S8 family serine peptidase [Neolewinella lacunae]|uniref:S8 family serine peptidase n=1 Tax=Neolewinella lacunae TaxID=1517758 RepID=A0A923T8P2_9BACT|nr:S8 family serine peptidase [Neolewinella lacunae]MBC6994779.1 S8 family serine peptidase [Neolewinella lacunae]MDN3634401.1 S8 family serine peptidase [Neolewinella lacunae]